MNNIYVPAQVFALIRRLANVLSSLSISNQYFLKRERVEDFQAENVVEDETQGNTVEKPVPSSWDTLCSLRQAEWPTWMNRNMWDWPRFMSPRGAQAIADSVPTQLSDVALRCVCLVGFSILRLIYVLLFSLHY